MLQTTLPGVTDAPVVVVVVVHGPGDGPHDFIYVGCYSPFCVGAHGDSGLAPAVTFDCIADVAYLIWLIAVTVVTYRQLRLLITRIPRTVTHARVVVHFTFGCCYHCPVGPRGGLRYGSSRADYVGTFRYVVDPTAPRYALLYVTVGGYDSTVVLIYCACCCYVALLRTFPI